MTPTPGHFVILGLELLAALFLTFGIWELGIALKKKILAGAMTLNRGQLILGIPGVIMSLGLPLLVMLANRFGWFGFMLETMPALLAMMVAMLFGMAVQVMAYLLFGLSVEQAQKKQGQK